ncbi:unnamed protein product [Ectocarpus sp. 8 AP-2014]
MGVIMTSTQRSHRLLLRYWWRRQSSLSAVVGIAVVRNGDHSAYSSLLGIFALGLGNAHRNVDKLCRAEKE